MTSWPWIFPSMTPGSGLAEYADAATRAIGTATDLVVVAQSMGGFTAGLVADQMPVELVILVAAMVPAPGESPGDWWANTGQPEAIRGRPSSRAGIPTATSTRSRSSSTTFPRTLPPNPQPMSAPRQTHRSRNRGPSRRGRRFPPASCCAGTIGCSRPASSGESSPSASASRPTRWTPATSPRSASRRNWPSDCSPTSKLLDDTFAAISWATRLRLAISTAALLLEWGVLASPDAIGGCRRSGRDSSHWAFWARSVPDPGLRRPPDRDFHDTGGAWHLPAERRCRRRSRVRRRRG